MRIVIACGIVGGFVPALITRQATFQTNEGALEIASHIRIPNSLNEYSTTTSTISLDLSTITRFIEEFKSLPIPLPGSPDFYGMDVGIEIDDENDSPFRWANPVQGGCDSTGEEEDQVIPTEAQKMVFSEFADYLLDLAFPK
jgi:hypothetical protein